MQGETLMLCPPSEVDVAGRELDLLAASGFRDVVEFLQAFHALPLCNKGFEAKLDGPLNRALPLTPP